MLLFHTELPLITIHPEGKTPMEGENITLSCNATGNPEPSISWVKDGFPMNRNSRINFSQDNKLLTITNISRTDSGDYRCVARNRVGNDTSNSKVNVLCKCRTLFYFFLSLWAGGIQQILQSDWFRERAVFSPSGPLTAGGIRSFAWWDYINCVVATFHLLIWYLSCKIFAFYGKYYYSAWTQTTARASFITPMR